MGLDNSDTVTKPRGKGEGDVFASDFLWLLGLLEGISRIIVQNDKAERISCHSKIPPCWLCIVAEFLIFFL